MHRLIPSLALLVSAAACSNSSGPTSPPPRATLRVIVQDSTYKPLLSAQGSFVAKVGEQREVRLVYQGSLPTDSGSEFLRFEVPADGLYRKPDGTPFGPADSIRITITVVDPKQFLFDFQPSGLQFNPSQPARLRVEYHYADQDFNGDGTIDSRDAAIETMLSLWRREPPDTLWFTESAAKSVELEEFDASILSFSQYAVAW
ncbi:MAG: hypothetical protein DMD60_10520 [Gemmatimonadetes bacterium]|nr:MAG: hypothetical protein DMD60_10520 [Gemmatimonadota bacterium]